MKTSTFSEKQIRLGVSEPHLHLHFTDRWAASSEPIRDFYASQGLPAVFWGAQVVHDGATLPLRGTAPIEFDVIGTGAQWTSANPISGPMPST